MTTSQFRKIIYSYYKKKGRRFPWRLTRRPYHILISEVMLQQTQASRVVEKYTLFIKKFPNIPSLARAPLKKIMTVWQGLGYNRRALQLKRTAMAVIRRYHGFLPNDIDELDSLPGICPATAASIAAFAFNQPTVFVETNIRSVFIHFYFSNKKKVSDDQIVRLVEKTLDMKNPRKWYNALMDYGAMLKEKYGNPNRLSRHYTKQSKFEGSDRQIRGQILRLLIRKHSITTQEAAHNIYSSTRKIKHVLAALESEGLIRQGRGKWMIV
jgi:A/G-specific adenine glycosylase